MNTADFVEIEEIGTRSNEIILVGRKFTVLENFYTDPYPSSALGIYVVSQLSQRTKLWSVYDINKKIMLLPLPKKRQHFAAITMLY